MNAGETHGAVHGAVIAKKVRSSLSRTALCVLHAGGRVDGGGHLARFLQAVNPVSGAEG
jgi:hypothetical protein